MNVHSIGFKTGFWSGLLLAVVGLSLTAYATLQMRQLSAEHREQTLEMTRQLVLQTAHQETAMVQARIAEALTAARTLAQALATLAPGDSGSSGADNGRREDSNRILNSVLSGSPELLGVYTAWEPNAFDGADAAFVNTPGSDATGRFIPYWNRGADGQPALESLQDYETPGIGDYYLRPKSTRREAIIDPYLYPVQGRDTLLTSLVVPILTNGVFRGMAGVDIALTQFQAQVDRVAAEFHDGQSTVAIVANDGTLVAVSGRPDLRGRSLEVLHDDWRENLTDIQAGRPLLEEHDGEIAAFAPVAIGQTSTPWSVQVMVPVALATQQADLAAAAANRANLIMALVALAFVAAGILAMLAIARAIVKPLRRATEALRQIAEGDGDLTRELDAGGRDELAELARAFNVFQGKIRDLIRESVSGSDGVAATAEQLSVTSDQTNHQVRRQQSETDQVATAMNEMTATVAEVARHAEAAAEAARQADREAAAGREVVTRTVASIDALSQQIQNASSTIGQLSQDALEIGRILEVIGGVAEQTNLLALNAAIEAARAGEQGRGFAVVADEVRTLASRTQASTREIQEMIERLQTGVARAVKAMDEGRDKARDSVGMAGDTARSLETMTHSVTTIKDMNNQIASAAEEQTAVATEIDRNIANISQVVDQIAAGSGEINRAAQELARLAADQQSRMSRFRV